MVYGFIFVGIMLLFALLAILISPKSKDSTIADLFADSEMSESVNKYIYGEPKSYSEKLSKFLDQSGTGITVPVYYTVMLMGGIAFFLIGYFLFESMVAGFVFAFVGYFVPRWYVGAKRKKVVEKFEIEFMRPLNRMISALIAKNTPSQAVESIALDEGMSKAVQDQFKIALTELGFGETIENVFYHMAERTGSRVVEFVATQIAINREQGGSLESVLEQVKVVAQDIINLRRQVLTSTAEQRGQATMITVIFAVLIPVTMLVNKSMQHDLLGTVLGHILMVVSVLSMVVGFLIIRQMVSDKYL